jgi:hypothetical protein
VLDLDIAVFRILDESVLESGLTLDPFEIIGMLVALATWNCVFWFRFSLRPICHILEINALEPEAGTVKEDICTNGPDNVRDRSSPDPWGIVKTLPRKEAES